MVELQMDVAQEINEAGSKKQDSHVLIRNWVEVFSDGGGAHQDGEMTAEKAWDDDTATYYDASDSSGFTGIRLHTAATLRRIEYHPRAQWASRMVGGKFEGASCKNGPWTTLHTISDQ